MLAIKKILVPIDFSETSTRVLEFARMLADACDASLELLHVIGYPMENGQAIEQQRRDACRRLDALLDSTDRDARQAITSCALGTPAREIVACATRHATDLIVMGTHWHGPTLHQAEGSIAEGVVGMAPCAVLAVKGTDQRPGETAFDPLPRRVGEQVAPQ